MNHEDDNVPLSKGFSEIEQDNRSPEVEFYVGSETMTKVFNTIATKTNQDKASRIIADLQHQGIYFREVRMTQ